MSYYKHILIHKTRGLQILIIDLLYRVFNLLMALELFKSASSGDGVKIIIIM